MTSRGIILRYGRNLMGRKTNSENADDDPMASPSAEQTRSSPATTSTPSGRIEAANGPQETSVDRQDRFLSPGTHMVRVGLKA
jgi:hypothetical protein